jgi:hypothetical protein
MRTGGVKGRPDEGGIAAIGAAVDGDACGIGDSFGDRPINRIEQVVVHLAAPQPSKFHRPSHTFQQTMRGFGGQR